MCGGGGGGRLTAPGEGNGDADHGGCNAAKKREAPQPGRCSDVDNAGANEWLMYICMASITATSHHRRPAAASAVSLLSLLLICCRSVSAATAAELPLRFLFGCR